MVRLLALLSFVYVISACGGILSGFRENNNNASDCSYIDIAQPSGKVQRTIAFPGCLDRGTQSNGVPKSCFRWSGGDLYWVSGTGAYVWQTDDSTAISTQYVTLPQHYNYTVGLAYVDSTGLFVLTTSDLLFAAEGDSAPAPLVSIASVQLSTSAVLTGDYFNPYLYIVDGTTIYTIDVTTPSQLKISTAKLASLNHVLDLAVYQPDTTQPALLMALQDYSLYIVDQTTGAEKYLMDMPKGTGLPSSNAIIAETWFVADNTTLYSLDVVAATVLTSSPFDGADLQSSFQYRP